MYARPILSSLGTEPNGFAPMCTGPESACEANCENVQLRFLYGNFVVLLCHLPATQHQFYPF